MPRAEQQPPSPPTQSEDEEQQPEAPVEPASDHVLIVVPSTPVVNAQEIERYTGRKVGVNTPSDERQDILITDLVHESTVDDRWPTFVIFVGDLQSKFRNKDPKLVVPANSATNHIVTFLRDEFYGEDEE